MGLRENFTAFWDRVTGKSLYEISQSVSTLEERLNMMQLDLDAANIKLASTEIDLEASNVEKEVLKLWKKNRVNPVNYQKDHNLKRKLYLLKKHFRYYKEYKNSYWKNNL